MTILLQRMREELVRRTYSETTIRSYLHAVEAFRQHVGKRSIISDLTIFAAIRFICSKTGNWRTVQLSSRFPCFASSISRC